MASPTPLTLTDLKPESDLLHLLFHRNKNQHRSSKWWKWFGMLRRNIKKLLDPTAAAGVEKRVEYMRRVVVPSCYTAFSSVVANVQFAPLGLTLLGVLARVHKIVGVEKRSGEEVGVEAVIGADLVKTRREVVMEPDTEDFGEAIVRREEVAEEGKNLVVQKETVGEVFLGVGGLVIKLKEEPSKERPITKDAKRRGEKTTRRKEKAIKSASTLPPSPPPPPPPPPPRLPSPLPLAKEKKLKTKSKRKSDDKEGTKKTKKRKKADEIDDLFAELL